MSFLTRELSRMLGRPVSLYYFNWGSAAASYYALTDGEETINAPAGLEPESSPPVNVDYVPEAISRGNITASGTLDKTLLELSTPRDSDLAGQFLIYPPAQVVTLVIRQCQRGETDSFPAIWVGRVTSMRFEGSTAIFSCEPVATSMRRTGLRRFYQYGCPHVLYGNQCRADKAAATVNVNVTAINGQNLDLPGGWNGSIPLAKYLGGLAEWTDPATGNVEVRTILRRHGSDNLVLGGLIRGLSPGQSVALSLGCNHQLDDCTDLHVETGTSPLSTNVKNYGGQPWIPLTNPVGKSQRIGTGLPSSGGKR